MKVELKHQNGFHSVISNDRGHRISIDTTCSEDPQGPSPMELLLMGVAGCSSIDIVSILNKQKIKPDSLHIQVEGDLIREIYVFSRNTGPSLSPFNAWILSKSIETLAVRLDKIGCDRAHLNLIDKLLTALKSPFDFKGDDVTPSIVSSSEAFP